MNFTFIPFYETRSNPEGRRISSGGVDPVADREILRDPNDTRPVVDPRGVPIPVARVLAHPVRVESTGLGAAIARGWPATRREAYTDALEYHRTNADGPRWGSNAGAANPPWRMTRAARAGTYQNQTTVTTAAEWRTDALLVSEGNDVVRPARPKAVSAADLVIAGRDVEVKSLETPSVNTAIRAIRRSVTQGQGAHSIVYDWRSQPMTRDEAIEVRSEIERDGRMPVFLRIIGRGFDLTWQLRPEST